MLPMIRFTTETCYSLLWHVVLVTMLTFVVPMFTLHSVDANQIVVMILASNLLAPLGGKLLYGAFGLASCLGEKVFLACPWLPLRLMLLCLQIENGWVKLSSKRHLRYMQRYFSLCHHRYVGMMQGTGSNMLLLLLILYMIPGVVAVCMECHGAAASVGCTGDPSTCPFATGQASNAAAIAGTTATAVVTIVKLLPLWVARLFTRDRLAVVVALAKRSGKTTVFNPVGKSRSELIMAVKTGVLSKDDAVAFCNNQADQIDLSQATDKDYPRLKDEHKSWLEMSKTLDDVRVLVESRNEDESNSSSLLYNLALISSTVCSEGKKKAPLNMSLAGDCDDDDSGSTHSSKAKVMTSKLLRPQSEAQMMRLLNMWICVCHATGVAKCLVTSAFLDEVVFQPIAAQEFNWAVGFEVLLQYLFKLEASNGTYQLGDIYAKAGGMDSIRRAAHLSAQVHFPSSLVKDPGFRALGGNPGQSTGIKEGDISGNRKAKKGCACYNLGTPHSERHLDSSGKCMFRHACDHRIDEKHDDGTYKHCLNAAGTPGHKRRECDHPKKL